MTRYPTNNNARQSNIGELLTTWGLEPLVVFYEEDDSNIVYIRCTNHASRLKIEQKLTEKGYVVNPDYRPSVYVELHMG